MKLKDLVQKFGLEVKAGPEYLDREVTGGYASDLLSDVLAHGEEGSVWITLHIHENIVAVASHKGLSGIILVQGRQPEQSALAKSKEEKIPILVSQLPAFELVGRLYGAGIRGM
ncbi:MAG TPA: serine kinase [Nitrospirota bacterium]|nr:serine kinase [Nitrospirota bacterium]